MKKNLTCIVLLFAVSVAQAGITRICTDKKSGLKVEIDSSCPMPSSATEDSGSKPVFIDKKTSTVKIYKNNKLLSKGAFSCSGIHKEDMIIFATEFKNENTEVTYGVLDDFGMDYANWVDVWDKKTDDEFRVNCR